MSRIEKLGMYIGIIGFMGISLVLFGLVAGLVEIKDITPMGFSVESMTNLLIYFSPLVLIYSWFSIGWYFTRRAIILINEKPVAFEQPLSSISSRFLLGTGLFFIPSVIAWFAILNFIAQVELLLYWGLIFSMGATFTLPLLFLGVWGTINLLMPVIHVELLNKANVFSS